MAYMNQQKKLCIAGALQKVVPADWQYTLSIDNCNLSIIMEIQAAPVDFMALKAAQLRAELQRGKFSSLKRRWNRAKCLVCTPILAILKTNFPMKSLLLW